MGVTITAGQRDAVYDLVLDRLSGIGAVWLAASAEDFELAERLSREYSDELSVVLDDLGWGDGPDGTEIELRADPAVLRRIFSRFKGTTAGERATGWPANNVLEERNRLIDEACVTVIQALDGTA